MTMLAAEPPMWQPPLPGTFAGVPDRQGGRLGPHQVDVPRLLFGLACCAIEMMAAGKRPTTT